MATGLIELIGTQIGTSGSNGGSGNDKTKVIDGNFTTFFDSPNASGDWVGVDAGAAVTVRRVQFAPRRGDSSIGTEDQYESSIIGNQIQGSSSSTFASDVTTVDTIPSLPPSYPSLNWNVRSTTSPPSKQYWRWLNASGRLELAELRFIADAGVSSAKPVRPTIAPWGGRYPAGSVTVTLACDTTSADLYYTTDGSTPTTGSTHYTGPFTLTIGGSGTTLKVIASDASLSTTLSDVSTSIFSPWGYKPNADWYDDRGILVEAHAGGFLCGAKGVPLLVGGFYWWYGENCNRYNVNSTFDGLGWTGIWLYKTTDFLNFIFVGNILDHSSTSSYAERPHVLYNAANNNYVLWANMRIGTNDQRAGVATASAPDGPWTWVTTSLDPDGLGYKDHNLFLDDTGTAYTVYNSTAGNMIVSQLASDFQSAGISHISVTLLAGLAREAPVIVKDHEGKYILIHSVTNVLDSASTFDLKCLFATSPLGTWSDPQPLFVADPIATDYNGQSSFVLVLPNGMLLGTDHWVQSDHYQSRQTWLPLDDYVNEPTSWDLSRFQVPANTLLDNLVAFYPLSEFVKFSDAVDRVGGLTAAATAAACQGVRYRSRDLHNTLGNGGFTHASNATFHTSGSSVWFNIWFRRLATGNFPCLITKDDVGSQREYNLLIDTSISKLQFLVSSDGSAIQQVNANTFGNPPVNGPWTMVTAWYDVATSKLGIAVNGVLDTEITYSAGIHDGTTAFAIGNIAALGTNFFDGYLRDCGMWKGPKPTSAMMLALYNNGLGLPYEYFTTSTPVAVLTGTAIGGLSESDVVAGGKTIVVTLTNDTFIEN